MWSSFKILFLCLLLSNAINGQSIKIDGLTQSLETVSISPAKADILHQLASETWDYDFEKSLQYAQASYKTSLEVNYKKGEAVALSDIGLYYYFKGNFVKALDFFQQSRRILGRGYCNPCLAQTLLRIGNVYRVKSNFDSAKWYYKNAFRYTQKNTRALSFYYFNVGVLHNMLSQHDSAMFYLRKSLTIRKQLKDSLLMAESLRHIGMVHKKNSSYDSAAYYYQLTAVIADQFKDPELQMFYCIYAGELYFLQGKYNEAVQLYSKALDLFKLHDFKLYSSQLYYLIGQVYDAQGDYQRALEHFFRALEIDIELENDQGVAQAHGIIAWTYLNQSNDTTALIYAENSLQTMKKIHDEYGIAYADNVLGNIYLKRADYTKSLAYFNSALAIHQKMNVAKGLAYTNLNLARLYEAQGKFTESLQYCESALQYCESALQFFRGIDNKPGLLLVYNVLGSLYTKTKNYSKAYEYLEIARQLSIALSSPVRLQDCYKNFTNLYQAKGNYPKMILYYEKLLKLNDSTFNNHLFSGSEKLTALYQVEKKEDEIKSLQQQNQLKQTEIRLQQSRIKWQQTLLIYTIVGIFLLVILAYTLFKYYRAKSIANDSLLRLNEEVNAQKEEIQTQAEELGKANDALTKLNNALIEKQEEIQAQSEELREANETISQINIQLETTVSKRTSQLNEAYKELDTFFYRSSHDFRRPLTTFMGLSEVAKITVKDQNALELFEKVSETAYSLDKMLMKLQSVSDVGAQHLVCKEVLIKEIYENVCYSLEAQMRFKSIRVISDINLQESFFSYPAMVKIILENLVENAIDFSGVTDPYIKLRAYQTHTHTILSIEDNGHGIPPKCQNRVFDMYFRGSDRSKGNGLGLYIVKKAVEKLEGTITVESTLYQGSTFRIELPSQAN